MFNGMCIHVVSSYMLIFYQAVMRLSTTNAGLIVTISRISGGLSTLVVGFLSDVDKRFWIYDHFGKRKVISILIIVSFRNYHQKIYQTITNISKLHFQVMAFTRNYFSLCWLATVLPNNWVS